MKNLIIMIFWIFTGGCATNNEKEFAAPTREIESRITIDKDSSLLIGNTNFIKIIDDCIYIYDLYGGFCFTKYDIANDKVHRFCKRGHGAGEVVMPSPAISSVLIGDCHYIVVFDQPTRKLLFFKSEDNYMNDQLIDEISYGKTESSIILSAFLLNDSTILATGAFGENICMFYKNGIEKGAFLESFTKIGNNNINRILKDANLFDLSPDKTHIVRVTQNGGLIELYRIENTQLIQQFSKKYFDVICNRDLSFNQHSRYGYIHVSITDNKIYALYDGGQIYRKNSFRSNTVHVYDMEGRLVEKILLDKYVSGIAVNKNNSKLYALSDESMELLLFNL